MHLHRVSPSEGRDPCTVGRAQESEAAAGVFGNCDGQDQIGPKFAVAMDPLRRYLREGDAGFPLTLRGLEGVERLKRLMKKATSFRAR